LILVEVKLILEAEYDFCRKHMVLLLLLLVYYWSFGKWNIDLVLILLVITLISNWYMRMIAQVIRFWIIVLSWFWILLPLQMLDIIALSCGRVLFGIFGSMLAIFGKNRQEYCWWIAYAILTLLSGVHWLINSVVWNMIGLFNTLQKL
jgi:hypothetical protein